MILEYIDNLRKQPSEVRRTVARFWTGVLVGVIALLYVAYLIVSATMLPAKSDQAASPIQAPYTAP